MLGPAAQATFPTKLPKLRTCSRRRSLKSYWHFCRDAAVPPPPETCRGEYHLKKSIFVRSSEPTSHCLNSRKPVIVNLLSGFLSTTDSNEWRGNQVLPPSRKSCIRFLVTFPSVTLLGVSPSTTRVSSTSKPSRSLLSFEDRSESRSVADLSPKKTASRLKWVALSLIILGDPWRGGLLGLYDYGKHSVAFSHRFQRSD